MKIKMSKHVMVDRADRMVYIMQTVGFGETVVFTHVHDGARECLTETGVIMVKAMHEERLITAYIPSLDKVSAMYTEMGLRVPQYMIRKIGNNQKYRKGF